MPINKHSKSQNAIRISRNRGTHFSKKQFGRAILAFRIECKNGEKGYMVSLRVPHGSRLGDFRFHLLRRVGNDQSWTFLYLLQADMYV